MLCTHDPQQSMRKPRTALQYAKMGTALHPPPTSSKNPPQREKTETETKLASKRTNAQGENGKVEIKVLPKLHTVYHAERGSSLSLTTGLESIL